MSAPPVKEARFHSLLFTRLQDYIQENETAFQEPRIEQDVDGLVADIFLPSTTNGSLVIEVKRDDVFPRRKDVIKQARNYADELQADFFATCNSQSFFLFNYSGEYHPSEIPYYSLRLTKRTLEDNVPVILNAVSTLYSEGELPHQAERDRVVNLLHSFHASIWPAYKHVAEKAYKGNEQFINDFDEWIHENDYRSLEEEEQFELAAKQYAYLLTNKVLFYEVVREKTPDEIPTLSGNALESLTGVTTVDYLDTHIRKKFDTIVEEIDYRPIFEDNTALFREFPESEKTKRDLQSLVEDIENLGIGDIDEDLLGGIYEELIPEGERKALGQFYTPPTIAETLVSWAIQNSEENIGVGEAENTARVLDPASGSGTFSVEAYQLLDHRFPGTSHQDIIDHIISIDINQFPLHLTALNLASQNISEKTDTIHAYHDSFFNFDPSTDFLQDTRIDNPPGGGSDEEMGLFDAAVGNPPYIRQENLHPNKTHFRTHLKSFGRPDSTTYYDGNKSLSKRCDAYIYFITHATQFLREGGRLGYIIPTKWMMTRYGESFQEFLYDHYNVHAIVNFSARAFEDALVDTCLLLAERCEDEKERRGTQTKFIRIKDEMDPQGIVSTADYTFDELGDELVVRNRPNYRIVAMHQAGLEDQDSSKIAHYLKAPQDLIELSQNPTMVPLETLADVSGGYMTGANDFFFIKREELDTWPIHERFLRPGLKSFRDVDGYSLTADDTGLYLLDVNDYIQEIKQETKGLTSNSSLEQRVKDAMKRDGYTTLAEYVNHGENQGYHTRRSFESREVWFNVGELTAPEIVHPYGIDERVVVARNVDGLVPSKRVQCLDVHSEIDSDVLAGYLNSSVHAALLEFWGRNEGGGSLEIMTYELEEIPILNITKLSAQDRGNISTAYENLVRRAEGAQQRLDKAVLSALESSIDPEKLQEMRNAVTQNRVSGAKETAVLVRDLDEFDDLGTRSFERGVDHDRREDAGNSSLEDFH